MPLFSSAHPELAHNLRQRYAEPHRHYHTMAHIEAMLAQFEAHRGSVAQPELVEAAIWFHDAIYDPLRHDNEAQSARLAAARLTEAGWPAERVDRVAGLIRMTAGHKAPPDDPDAALLLDLDLAILAAPSAAYAWYVKQIRQEYAHVSDNAFQAGRAGFVEQMLARQQIYLTPGLEARWERKARYNLKTERDNLPGRP